MNGTQLMTLQKIIKLNNFIAYSLLKSLHFHNVIFYYFLNFFSLKLTLHQDINYKLMQIESSSHVHNQTTYF